MSMNCADYNRVAQAVIVSISSISNSIFQKILPQQ